MTLVIGPTSAFVSIPRILDSRRKDASMNYETFEKKNPFIIRMRRPLVRVHTEVTDSDRLGATLASSHQNDPLFHYILGKRTRRRDEGVKRMMQMIVRRELTRPGGVATIHSTANEFSVAIWHKPNKQPETRLQKYARMLFMVRNFGVGALSRLMTVGSVVRKEHATEKHVSLYYLGTEARSQGNGLGAKVIAPMLRKCDREGLPICVYSSNPRNHSFYVRHGFEIITEFNGLPEACPRLVRMWRVPKRGFSFRIFW